MGTGASQNITITSSTNLSDADIDKAIKEAQQFEAEDKKRKEEVDNRNKLDGLIFTIEKTIKDLGDKISEEDKAKLEEEVKEAKAELESNDNDRIVKATEKLSEASQGIFAKIYQQANPNGEAGANPENGGDTEFHQ
jgi:molecular chaperone DnaK